MTGLATDSRLVRPGDLFLARAGHQAHGGEFVDQAIEAGAAAVAADIDGEVVRQVVRGGVPVFGIPGLAELIGAIASRFHGHPSHALEVVGVTGTNGKTTVTRLLAHVLHRPDRGRVCGLIGTLGYGLPGALEAGPHTTPDAVALQARLAALRDAGATHVAMEVSSHALAQYRVDGVRFAVAGFTNLSHDHLDYHGDMVTYGRVKRRLFLQPGLRGGLINADDPFGRKLLTESPGMARLWSYGLEAEHGPLVLGANLCLGDQGLDLEVRTPWGDGHLHSPLLGRFNASNLLAAAGLSGALGLPMDEVLGRLGEVTGIPGRMEAVRGPAGRPLVVVDYAHTPDALAQVLTALRAHTKGRLWCVFGCGGERDRGKRRPMGEAAERGADQVVVTWDNPRGEEPGDIVGQILGGMDQPQRAHVERDRGKAIAHAIDAAGQDDLVLIAGKGHEEVQIVGDRRLPFSDREEARRRLARR